MGELIEEYTEVVPGTTGIPVATSSRKGLFLQDEYFNGGRTGIDESVDFHRVPQGYITYRHMSDDSIFHFNQNGLGTDVLVSKEYPVFKSNDLSDQRFILANLNNSSSFLNFSMMQKKGGTRVRLYFEILKKYGLKIPIIEEQTKIGTFFEKLDSLIATNQRKLKKTKALKSAYLSEMFPSKDENKPKLRFAGFTNAWEQRRLDAVFAPIPNNTLSRANLNYTIGKIKNVHYGDILIKYGAVTDCRRDEIPFITGGEIFDYRSQLLQEGDILIADAAEDETVGKATEIAGISNIPVVSGLHTIACRPKVKMQPCYLGYYMNSPSYHQQLLPLMQGIKVLSISRTNLAKTTVFYPISEQEQSQIGRLFAGLDHLITLHQRKLEELQELKKAYLQQMFI
ncbi:restriction endonuclease subunit S [Sporolactobacillus sp. CQH2019]|uniref:restriction endonuclease subunit S n=1 Tax=Sporolactobacillus sp. CQH2019 TaxID=3023512 RepID=UPI002368ED08|nr:restriction endonuclease subunit S [Sporolactobacillus sp. CQH2019]MDD9149971.1 restriction endonuclease subunit S [Sporolactobacillus sp. CQH2019]